MEKIIPDEEPRPSRIQRLRNFMRFNNRPNLQYLYLGFSYIRVRIVYAIPFLKEFHKCSRSDTRQAAIELAITTFFSTMPLWIMPVVGPIIFRNDFSYIDHLLSTIKDGELFVYCAALIGPLIYIISRRYGEVSKNEDEDADDESRFNIVIAFPHGLAFIISSALICILSGFAFGLIKNPVFGAQLDDTKFNQTGIFWSSILIYLFSLYCFFSASAYRNAMSGFVRDTRTEEDEFATTWESRNDAE